MTLLWRTGIANYTEPFVNSIVATANICHIPDKIDSFLKNNCCNVVKENHLCFVVNRDIPSINRQLSNRKYTILN